MDRRVLLSTIKMLAIGFYLFNILGCSSPEKGQITDINGYVYNTIVIGEQVWMSENLRVSKYRDGTPIPGIFDDREWTNSTEGAYAIYPHNKVEGLNSEMDVVNAYGKLYNWFAVHDEKGLCPEGWRIPTTADWDQLTDYISGSLDYGGGQLKSCRQVSSSQGGDCKTVNHPRWEAHGTHFDSDVLDAIGKHEHTDEYGFSGLPGGCRNFAGSYSQIGEYGYWWTASEHSSERAWSQFLFYHLNDVFRMPLSKQEGLSVRCIKVSE